eukprot:SAG11_NODE_17163_length_526_cov_1.255269_2_plen_41_part_01
MVTSLESLDRSCYNVSLVIHFIGLFCAAFARCDNMHSPVRD